MLPDIMSELLVVLFWTLRIFTGLVRRVLANTVVIIFDQQFSAVHVSFYQAIILRGFFLLSIYPKCQTFRGFLNIKLQRWKPSSIFHLMEIHKNPTIVVAMHRWYDQSHCWKHLLFQNWSGELNLCWKQSIDRSSVGNRTGAKAITVGRKLVF